MPDTLVPVAVAEEVIFNNLIELPVQEKYTEEAEGYILQEPIMADRDFPPFPRVMMDGIAIRYENWEQGQRNFPVQTTQMAGSPPVKLDETVNCVEIMTGAVCPEGLDTVIRVEDILWKEQRDQRSAQIQNVEIKKGQNIHPQGLDRKAGDILVEIGKQIGSPEIAVAASVGKTSLKVSQMPHVSIISTGDELVEIYETPLPHQIRRSNVYALQAPLKERHCDTALYHLKDDLEGITQGIANLMKNTDILILSGGVSKGKADYVPQALEALGVEKIFHRVKQRPGKPFWFGRKGNKVVFALPGNPVSTVACFHRYVLPYIDRIIGKTERPRAYAQLMEAHTFPPDLTLFLPVQTHINANGVILAKPLAGHGSGDFANLVDCDAFLELPAERADFQVGEAYPLWKFRV